MPRVGFELTISAGERPKTYALDRAVTGIGYVKRGEFLDYLKIGWFLEKDSAAWNE